MMTDGSPAKIALPAAGRYRIDPDKSKIHYTGKHMFGTGTVHATFALKVGELQIEDPVATSHVTVTVDASSFSSNNARRDKDVRSARLLDVESHPDITFTSEGLREDGDGWLVAGTIMAHGNTASVEVHVDRVTSEGAGVRVHGRAEHLDRTALGITGSKGMVGRYLDLELDAFAVPV